MRLIDADALKHELCIRQHLLNADSLWKTLEIMDAQPTADVKEVKHGHWNKTCVPDVYQCDVCKKPVKMDEFCDNEILREFCPKCGADMRGDKDDEGNI